MLQRTGSQSFASRQVFHYKTNLPPSCWLQLYCPFSRAQRGCSSSVVSVFCQIESAAQTGINNMMNWVKHLNPRSYRPAEIKARWVFKRIVMSVCLDAGCLPVTEELQSWCLFCSHACHTRLIVEMTFIWANTSETLQEWQHPQYGEHINTHTAYACVFVWRTDTVLISEFVVEPWNSPRDGIRLCDVSASQGIKHCWVFASC